MPALTMRLCSPQPVSPAIAGSVAALRAGAYFARAPRAEGRSGCPALALIRLMIALPRRAFTELGLGLRPREVVAHIHGLTRGKMLLLFIATMLGGPVYFSV